MKPELKQRVRRYGIPIDLVILATGAAMLFRNLSGLALAVAYLFVVGLSTRKLGWRSGLTAAVFALVVMFAFPSVHAAIVVTFVLLSAAVIAVADSFIRGLADSSTRRFADSRKQRRSERLQLEARLAEERAVGERAAAEKLETERKERERVQREKDELARQLEERASAERATEKLEAERKERERLEREPEELARTVAEERAAAERASAEKLEAERKERERLEREPEELARKVEEERSGADRAAAEKLEVERKERERLEREREELARKVAEERAAAERASAEKLEAERKERERLEHEREELARKVEEQRAALEQLRISESTNRRIDESALEQQLEQRLAAERTELQKKYDAQLQADREALAKAEVNESAKPRLTESPKPGMFSTLTSWLKTPQRPKPAVTPKPRKPIGTTTGTKRPVSAAPVAAAQRPKPQPRERRPRILMLERRRATADTAMPRLRDMGIDVQIVERWIDGVDEIFRFRPDAIFVDAELPDFMKVHKSIVEQAPTLPIFVTAGSHGALPNVPRAASVIRPYSAEGVAKLARESASNPQMFLERQQVVRGEQPTAAVQPPPSEGQPGSAVRHGKPEAVDHYEVVCFSCRVAFDATEADWCSCLTKERTLVCTNCLTCFCKAPPAYKEKFWVEAPATLFERKSAELRKRGGPIQNAAPEQLKRPLVMLVEDDEDIPMIVHRVCTNLGYGFITAPNGQDGLNLARTYKPNLILSDAFMPKLDGREMCHILKEESVIPECKMIVMTGLYTDTKYKSEALKRFHIDDYLSKPVSISDLINLLQKHLEGVAGAPPQEDLHELHRKDVEAMLVEDFDEEHGIPLAELLEQSEEHPAPAAATAARKPQAQAKTYDICCFTCGKIFDAAQAEWCTCLGHDQTLVCPHCNTCFCKSPAAYKERFWMDAPSMLFERKMIGSKRNVSGKANPSSMEVKRPLILLVEDDENIQLIVKTVVTSMGYGFIVAANGQEGLAFAREYNPDLILSDAFMPKLDGREMCRLLKEDPATARTKAIIMTGLYTDRKYRNEALSYFKVDDYVAKPVAVDDLIKLMKKHLPQEVQPTM